MTGHGVRMAFIRRVGLLGPLLLVGCALPTPPSPSAEPQSVSPYIPSVHLGTDVLVSLTYSGWFLENRERTHPMHPHIVVFRDGVVVANASPLAQDLHQDYAFVTLNEAELGEVENIVADAGIHERRPTRMDYPVSGGSIAIFAIPDRSGRAIEMSVPALYSTVPDIDVSQHPPELVALDRMLGTLRERVVREGVPYQAELPGVPIVQSFNL